ncbi:MAG: hypothetical protein K6G16_04135 [Lachnospiraceae bacterium]|nr:hypothetical protein [Lachnospiraceae bacterium]
MNITQLDPVVLKNFKSVLDPARFPQLAAYRDRIDALNYDAIKSALDHDRDWNVFHSSSDLRIIVAGEEAAKAAGPHMQAYLDVIRTIREQEKDLLRREPFLDSYLSAMQDHMERALSDRDDALDPYRTELGTVTQKLLGAIDTIPDDAALRQHPDAGTAFDLLCYSAGLFGYDTEVLETIRQAPGTIDQQTYDAGMKTRLTGAIAAAERFNTALVPDSEGYPDIFRTFCTKMSDEELAGMIGEIWDYPGMDDRNKRPHGIGRAAANLREMQQGLDKGITVGDSMMMQETRGVLRGIRSDVAMDPSDVEGKEAQDIVEKIQGAERLCESAMDEGFLYDTSRRAIFTGLQRRLSEISDLASAYHPFSGDKPLTVKESDSNILAGRVGGLDEPHGLKARLQKHNDAILGPQKQVDAGLKDRIAPFYEMMQKTKGGWFGHSNSKEYEQMMHSIESVMKILDKGGKGANLGDELTEIERKELAVHLKEVERTCGIYLQDKAKERWTDTGKDRYAGALGILEALNPAEADKVMKRANEVRKKHVTLQELDDRAVAKTGRRPRRDGHRMDDTLTM